MVVNDLGSRVDGSEASSDAADGVVAEIRAAGGEAVANYDSVSTPEGGAAIVGAAVAAFGRLDIVVNNAGILGDAAFKNMTPERVDAVLDVHLRGAFHVLMPAWSVLREQNYGRVINTTSGSGLFGNFSSAAAAQAATVVEVYPIAKSAVEALTRQLALELGPSGIRLNAIGPGFTLTEGSAHAYEGDSQDKRAQMVPLRRIGTPTDIADAVGFLVSEQASYISGQILFVDGGLTAPSR